MNPNVTTNPNKNKSNLVDGEDNTGDSEENIR